LAAGIEFGCIKAVAAQANQSEATGKEPSLIGTEWKLRGLGGKPVPHDGLASYFALKENKEFLGGSIGRLVNSIRRRL
jgi:hypothetical protein